MKLSFLTSALVAFAALVHSAYSSSWTQIATGVFRPARSDQAVTQFNGSLVFTGQENYTIAYNCSNQVLLTADGTSWNDLGNAPWSARAYSAAATVLAADGSEVYLLAGGGCCTPPYTGPVCHTYDWEGDLWQSTDLRTFQPVPVAPGAARWGARGGHSMDSLNGVLVLAGGLNNTYQFSDVWLSKDGVSWELALAEAPWGGRSFHATAVMNGALFLTGGGNFTAIYGDIWSTIDGVTWKQLPTPAWRPRFAHALSYVPAADALVLTGGYISVNAIACAEVWVTPASAAGTGWVLQTANASWGARSFQNTAVLPATGELILAGGWTIDMLNSWPFFQYAYFGDVWRWAP